MFRYFPNTLPCSLAVLSLFAVSISNSAYADTPGSTYTCHFGRYGTVVIDTRYPGATLTINGKKYEVYDGSYFYETRDGKISIMFGPNMKSWEYEGIIDKHCVLRKNLPLRKSD